MNSELKIEVGKFYKTRDGRKVRIYESNALGIYPIHGAILDNNASTVESWTRDGESLEGAEDPSDIVSAWVDKYPRNGEPAWATHRAMDEYGKWHWFSGRAKVGEVEWYPETNNSLYGVIPPSHAQPFTGDWKDSLQELE